MSVRSRERRAKAIEMHNLLFDLIAVQIDKKLPVTIEDIQKQNPRYSFNWLLGNFSRMKPKHRLHKGFEVFRHNDLPEVGTRHAVHLLNEMAFNWWGHSICKMEVTLIPNSWGMSDKTDWTTKEEIENGK